jgi:hypothetical protein
MSQVERCRICGGNGTLDQFSAEPPLEYGYCCENISGCGIIGPSRTTREDARLAWNELMVPTLWTQEAIDAAGLRAAEISAYFNEGEVT